MASAEARRMRRRVANAAMLGLTAAATVLTVSVLFFILGYLVYQGGSSVSLSFFTELPKPVGEAGGGMANAIVGSGKLLLIATLTGVPIGFLAGVYVAEFASPVPAFVLRYATDLLNGVPSIVVGIFVYALIVLPMKQFSTVAGGVALGIIMIPIALRSTEEYLRSVPKSLREASLALGASRATTIVRVIVPAASGGIVTALMLNLARVAGETAPLLFTALNNRFWSRGWLDPTASLPVMIFTYAIAPYPDWHRQAWAAGLVLLGLVLVTNIGARWLLARRRRAGA